MVAAYQSVNAGGVDGVGSGGGAVSSNSDDDGDQNFLLGLKCDRSVIG